MHLTSPRQVIQEMAGWVEAREHQCRRIVVTGFHGIWEAHKSPDLKAVLNSADLWVPDGIAPVWVARLKGFRGIQRIPGADLMRAFLERANERGYSSFFYGDRPETLSLLRQRLEREYPNHGVAGTFSPPFGAVSPEEDEAHVRMINEARPDVLWVGLGLPKQERWIAEHQKRLRVPVAVGVGAAFGFLSGRVKRAPAWVGRCGFEWLWRLVHEPRKVWRRDFLDGPRFLGHVLLELSGLRKYE
ncbi:MAG TPA: WecB/TagA/CpsF family glycosyltransferase [Planctomycetota bacterium]|nr:WecB/TagA/CpsF family glycosyltransferase [Planctomycetota bacterium]HRT93275.1 WecB/TagA/CpsF family glycosyltransferase [Planctomycetota bacterium]